MDKKTFFYHYSGTIDNGENVSVLIAIIFALEEEEKEEGVEGKEEQNALERIASMKEKDIYISVNDVCRIQRKNNSIFNHFIRKQTSINPNFSIDVIKLKVPINFLIDRTEWERHLNFVSLHDCRYFCEFSRLRKETKRNILNFFTVENIKIQLNTIHLIRLSDSLPTTKCYKEENLVVVKKKENEWNETNAFVLEQKEKEKEEEEEEEEEEKEIKINECITKIRRDNISISSIFPVNRDSLYENEFDFLENFIPRELVKNQVPPFVSFEFSMYVVPSYFQNRHDDMRRGRKHKRKKNNGPMFGLFNVREVPMTESNEFFEGYYELCCSSDSLSSSSSSSSQSFSFVESNDNDDDNCDKSIKGKERKKPFKDPPDVSRNSYSKAAICQWRENFKSTILPNQSYIIAIKADDFIRSGICIDIEKAMSRVCNLLLEDDSPAALDYLFPVMYNRDIRFHVNFYHEVNKLLYQSRKKSTQVLMGNNNNPRKYIKKTLDVPNILFDCTIPFDNTERLLSEEECEKVICYTNALSNLSYNEKREIATSKYIKEIYESNNDDEERRFEILESDDSNIDSNFELFDNDSNGNYDYDDDDDDTETSLKNKRKRSNANYNIKKTKPVNVKLSLERKKEIRIFEKYLKDTPGFSINRIIPSSPLDDEQQPDGILTTPYISYPHLKIFSNKKKKTVPARKPGISETTNIRLPNETYRLIPIWLFPFVVSEATSDSLLHRLFRSDFDSNSSNNVFPNIQYKISKALSLSERVLENSTVQKKDIIDSVMYSCPQGTTTVESDYKNPLTGLSYKEFFSKTHTMCQLITSEREQIYISTISNQNKIFQDMQKEIKELKEDTIEAFSSVLKTMEELKEQIDDLQNNNNNNNKKKNKTKKKKKKENC
jgi:hypothetical protein